jgi:hypothetical protein
MVSSKSQKKKKNQKSKIKNKKISSNTGTLVPADNLSNIMERARLNLDGRRDVS